MLSFAGAFLFLMIFFNCLYVKNESSFVKKRLISIGVNSKGIKRLLYLMGAMGDTIVDMLLCCAPLLSTRLPFLFKCFV